MIVSFRNRGTEDIFEGTDSKAARATCPPPLWTVAKRKLDRLDAAKSLDFLKKPYGNRLEMLKWERAGQYAIRINSQYRVCFWWSDQGATDVEITDYH